MTERRKFLQSGLIASLVASLGNKAVAEDTSDGMEVTPDGAPFKLRFTRDADKTHIEVIGIDPYFRLYMTSRDPELFVHSIEYY